MWFQETVSIIFSVNVTKWRKKCNNRHNRNNSYLYLNADVTSHYKRHLMSIYEREEIVALSKRQAVDKLSKDTKFVFFLLFCYKLFCPISQNKPGRYKVPFVVLRHGKHTTDVLEFHSLFSIISYLGRQESANVHYM